jgi:hypothetical protein
MALAFRNRRDEYRSAVRAQRCHELYRIGHHRLGVRLATAESHVPRRRPAAAGGAAHLSLCRAELSGARRRVTVVGAGPLPRLRPTAISALLSSRLPRSLVSGTARAGDSAPLAIQPLGHDRSAQCDLSRPDRGRHRSRLACRGILHPDGDRTCAVDHSRADLPPPAAAEGLILHPGLVISP